MNDISHQAVIEELLAQACPSIQYRLRAEVLGEPGDAQPMRDLQTQILNDPLVQEVIGWQQPDGWLGWNFHGERSIETGIRVLCEKGITRDEPVLSRALESLVREPGRLSRGIGKAGEVLDQSGFGGLQMIRAALFAQVGTEDEPFIREQIEVALAGFRQVLTIQVIEDLVETYNNIKVYRPDRVWPSIYHLRLLAFTHGWRSANQLAEISQSIQRLVELSPLPYTRLRHHSQLIAPASYAMREFAPDLNELDDAHWMMWFHRTELLARLGVVHRVAALQEQVDGLKEILVAGRGRFTRTLIHSSFRKWGPYTGLMLERDWRESRRRMYDLTFRSLLILHHSETQALSRASI